MKKPLPVPRTGGFSARMLPTTPDLAFREEGYYVWCGSMFRCHGKYYLAYSRWKKEYGFDGWVTHSEIALARADSLLGAWTPLGKILPCGAPTDWDADCAHNPTVLQYGDTFYLYHMANHGDGTYWNHRNHQRIAVAWTKDPEGIWQKASDPVIDISPEGVDSLMTSNPTAAVGPDGQVLMVYKAVSKYGAMPKGGAVVCAAATAPHPLGPFTKYHEPIMVNPENDWSVEDPFIWYEGQRFYALVKDFQGYFTQAQKGSTALFVSADGRNWGPAAIPLAYDRVLDFGTSKLAVDNLERPQIYIEDGVPRVLLCAVLVREGDDDTYNIRIPLQWEGGPL